MSWQSWASVCPHVESSRCLNCNPQSDLHSGSRIKNLVVADLLMTIWVTGFVEQC